MYNIKIKDKNTGSILMIINNVSNPDQALSAYSFEDAEIVTSVVKVIPKKLTLWQRIKRFFGFKV